MATRAVIPYSSASCCVKRQFSTAFPSALTGHVTPDEFTASIQRINAANRVGAAPMLAWIGSWFLYAAGLSIIFNSWGKYDSSYGYAGEQWWTGLGVLIVGIIALCMSGRWIRTRRADSITNAVLVEHNAHQHRGLAYRVINAGTRSSTLEIDVMAPVSQHAHFVAMPVPHGHEQVHVHAYTEPQQYQPYFAHAAPSPVPQVQPPVPHYAPAQPQYVHASAPANPAQYHAAAYPQVDHRAPLISHY